VTDIAIVVTAFNRPKALQRLLNSIKIADYTAQPAVDLIVSIDFSGFVDCAIIAENFEWKFGQKIVINHIENLGLKAHIISCGSYVNKYDAIILIEDDVFVGRYFFDFAVKSFNEYYKNPRIAGVALFGLHYNEIGYCPFEPIIDGCDTYFMQVPASWGQVFWKSKWSEFIEFLENYNDDFANSALPAEVKIWNSNTSWKKYYYEFIVHNDYYFVYPREGHVTNFGDTGTHYSTGTYVWQNALSVGLRNYKFGDLDSSISIYDSHMELTSLSYSRITNNLISVEFDINGTKNLSNIKAEYLFSTKHCNKVIQEYSMDLYPYENNILYNIHYVSLVYDYKIKFARTIDFEQGKIVDRLKIDSLRMLGKDYYNSPIKSELKLKYYIKYIFRRFLYKQNK
jgi:hypothetical protein